MELRGLNLDNQTTASRQMAGTLVFIADGASALTHMTATITTSTSSTGIFTTATASAPVHHRCTIPHHWNNIPTSGPRPPLHRYHHYTTPPLHHTTTTAPSPGHQTTTKTTAALASLLSSVSRDVAVFIWTPAQTWYPYSLEDSQSLSTCPKQITFSILIQKHILLGKYLRLMLVSNLLGQTGTFLLSVPI